MMTKQQSYQSGPNAAALGEYYRQYLTSPEALDEDWRRFFTDLDDEARPPATSARRPWIRFAP
jgi:2-oxoglutarate dehydrogenase complex dehydrogenase (E1) component-like enzyme